MKKRILEVLLLTIQLVAFAFVVIFAIHFWHSFATEDIYLNVSKSFVGIIAGLGAMAITEEILSNMED